MDVKLEFCGCGRVFVQTDPHVHMCEDCVKLDTVVPMSYMEMVAGIKEAIGHGD